MLLMSDGPADPVVTPQHTICDCFVAARAAGGGVADRPHHAASPGLRVVFRRFATKQVHAVGKPRDN